VRFPETASRRVVERDLIVERSELDPSGRFDGRPAVASTIGYLLILPRTGARPGSSRGLVDANLWQPLAWGHPALHLSGHSNGQHPGQPKKA
jgi:hypothetical protein